jgi:alpha-mannosidase II
LEIISARSIQINNRLLSITFSKSGAILDVQHKKRDEKIRFRTNIIQYGTSKTANHNSGAYIFIPDGNARDVPISNSDLIRIQQGALVSQVNIIHEIYGLQYRLTNTNS